MSRIMDGLNQSSDRCITFSAEELAYIQQHCGVATGLDVKVIKDLGSRTFFLSSHGRLRSRSTLIGRDHQRIVHLRL